MYEITFPRLELSYVNGCYYADHTHNRLPMYWCNMPAWRNNDTVSTILDKHHM
jgi:hypothetical protein